MPQDRRALRAKPGVARAEVDRLLAAGARFGVVLADAGHGIGAPLRHGPSQRGLLWAVGMPRHLKVHPADAGMIFPVPGRARAAGSRPARPRRCSRRPAGRRAGGAAPRARSAARFAALRARVADGPAWRIGESGDQHPPGEEAWLVGEHRTSGERKRHLSNLPAETDPKTLASAIKARWSCEQAHQRMKEELGLDHFEGRSWAGLHRHALMTMIARAFLQYRRLAKAGRGKKSRLATPRPQPAGGAPRDRGRAGARAPAPATQLPAPQAMDQATTAA